MAVLQTIRNRAGILIAIVIGLALVAFIIGDFLQQGGPGQLPSDLEVAEIRGKSVSYEELQTKILYLTDISKLTSQQTNLDDQAIQQIAEQSWDQLVREYVLNEEYDNLGLAVHPEEVFDMVQGRNIHPYIANQFRDPNTGQVNRMLILQFLKNKDQDERQRQYWSFIENEIITERIYRKYTNLLSKGLYVTNPFAEQQLKDDIKKVNFNFAVRKYITYPDSAIKVTDGEIKKYYKEHIEDFKQKALRDIEYVLFEVVPSEADDAYASKYINDIVEEFNTTENDREYVNLNSDIPFVDKNFKDGELSDVINDFMFKADTGDMFGPYFENDAYKIAKLSEINHLPDSVRARHIFIQPLSQEDIERAKALADSLKEAIENGRDFAALAIEYSMDESSADKGGDLGWFKEGTKFKSFNDACFEGKIGEIVLVESQTGYHIIEVLNKGKKVKKVKVAIVEKIVEPSTQTYQIVYQKANKFASTVSSYDSFLDQIDKDNLNKRSANDLKEFDKSVPGIDDSRALVKWIYEAEMDNVYIHENDNGFVVAILTGIQEEGYNSVDNIRDEIIAKITEDKKAELIIEEITNSSNISSLDEFAKKYNTEVIEAANIRFSASYLPNAGYEPSIIAAAFNLGENILSKPIKGKFGVYMISVSSFSEDPRDDVVQHKNNLMNAYVREASFKPYETLKELADIKDYRAKYY